MAISHSSCWPQRKRREQRHGQPGALTLLGSQALGSPHSLAFHRKACLCRLAGAGFCRLQEERRYTVLTEGRGCWLKSPESGGEQS